MSSRPSSRFTVTRHEDKEQRLKEFILQHIKDADLAVARSEILIVARSVDSPVVRAIGNIEPQIGAARLLVRMILAQVEPDTASGLAEAGANAAFDHEIRWARHPRLIEAHEQLVLGPATCWIGDCMRRDPSKCDAFENYVEDCGEAAGCAAVSFERLWSASVPLVERKSEAGVITPLSPPKASPETIAPAQR
jgi:hypothetical protein